MNLGATKFRLLRKVAKANIWLREHRILGEIYEIIDGTVGDYIRDHGLVYAAAVSFYALMSLVPFLVLFASATGFFLASMGVGSDINSERILAEVVAQLRRGIPYIQPEFERDLERIVNNRTGLGIAGFFGLMLASSQVFRALEFAFARIFARQVEKRKAVVLPRSVIVSKLLFGGFIVALVFAFLLFQIFIQVMNQLTQLLPAFVNDMLEVEIMGTSIFSHGITSVAVVLGFATLMKMFTKQKVKFQFALIGGVVYFLLWQMSRFAYEIYISHLTDLASLYGGFTTLIVIVLWVFYSSMLLLIAGEFVQTIQRRFLYGPKWPKGDGAIKARKIAQVERDEERQAELARDVARLDPEALSRAFAIGMSTDETEALEQDPSDDDDDDWDRDGDAPKDDAPDTGEDATRSQKPS